MKHLKIKDIIVNTSPEKVPIGTIPYIEIGDIDIFNKTYQYKDKKSVSGAKYALKDSIIVSTVRPTRGAISIIKEEKIAVSNAFAIINVDKEQCNYKYLFYMINSNKFYEYLGSNSKGATYPTCSREDVYNYEIVLPSLEEQNKIVKIFENISNNTNIKKQQILSLEQLVKSQFIEMFGNGNKWNITTLESVSNKITDGEHGTVPRQSYGNLYLMARNITDDSKLDLDEVSFISDEVFNKLYSRCNPEEGDILLVCVGATIGKVALVPKMDRFSLARSVALIKTNNSLINNIYLLHLIKDDFVQSQIKMSIHGGAQSGLYTNMIKKIKISLPPIELQNKFAGIVKQIDKQKYEFEKQLEKLKELQESLMKEYFG